MCRVFAAVCASDSVQTCRLVGGKITFVHRRLWPALVRLANRLPKGALTAVREEHTERGSHRTVEVPFPAWVPKQIRSAGRRLSETTAVAHLGNLASALPGLEPDRPDALRKPPVRTERHPRRKQPVPMRRRKS